MRKRKPLRTKAVDLARNTLLLSKRGNLFNRRDLSVDQTNEELAESFMLLFVHHRTLVGARRS